MKIKIGIFIGISFGFLTACKMPPKTSPVTETYQRAQQEIQQMFREQTPICDSLDFNQAIARGLQYNLDHRIKQANSVIKAGQMELASYAMMPEANVSASLYTRNNNNESYASGSDDRPTNTILNGSDRTLRSARAGIKWNIIDLGLGYVKTLEAGERLLIAEEESRQKLQELVNNLRISYWNAYNAQLMNGELQRLQQTLIKVRHSLNMALKDKLVPKDDLLAYQSNLLDNDRRLLQLEQKLNKAALEFRYLVNLPLNQKIKLKKPPISITKIQNLKNLDFEKLDAITMVNRPELRSQHYQLEIAKLGSKAAILQALPGITLNAGRNFDSNSFLVNNFWNDRSIESSWNIMNLASLPVSLKVAKTQAKYEQLKLMAATMGALNETRIAYSRYQFLSKECIAARNQVENTASTYRLLRNRESVSLASKQEVVLANLKALFAKIDEILLLADLSAAMGDLYLSAGFDVLPVETVYATPKEVLCIVEKNLKMQENRDFKHYVNVTYQELFEKGKCKNK